MSSNECNILIENYNESYKNNWEQTRYIAYIVAATQNDKIKKPQDLLKFSWEIENELSKEKITKEEIIQREKEMLEWLSRQK